ncbi:MAG: N-acetyltransferase [Bacteroidales bacterium]
MSVNIKVISTRNEFKNYVHFRINLYKDCPYAIPPLVLDEISTLDPLKNPAYDFCESISLMAYKKGHPVGRITGIINNTVNKKTGRKIARFGWVDFVDDFEVSNALMEWIENWASRNGMNEVVGPLGFSDMDPEGCLIEGFDQLGTMETIYNYPYYEDHFTRLGYKKEKDWVEFKIPVPDALPEKHIRIAKIVKERYNLNIVECKSIHILAKRYGQQLFQLINESYSELYGYSTLTKRQIDHYVKMYLPMLHNDEVAVVENDQHEVIGVGIAIPSLAKALQKAKGKIFPFGWFHLLKALKAKNDIADLLLIAVRPDYQNKGVNALFFEKIFESFSRRGYKMVETNPELEDNNKIHQQWQYFNPIQHKRRRAFMKQI